METSASDYILLPLLLTFFGAFVYGLSLDAGLKKGKLARARWVGTALFLLGTISGFSPAWQMMTDPFYNAATVSLGKKVVLAHWLGFLIPFASLVTTIVLDATSRARLGAARRNVIPEATPGPKST